MNMRDLEHCRVAIRHGSRSFHAASKLLPRRVRDPALALYAFCRLADDEVDLRAEKAAAVLRLQDRLDRVYEGRPVDAPADRAFAALVEMYDMPRALPDALLEGLAWDAQERRYETMSELTAYSARVASAVGVMMAVLMGTRDQDALARACDLGVAMQLTNIARDIGEDARANRLYLPLYWMDEMGVRPDEFLAKPAPSPAIRTMTRRLLEEAKRLYVRSEAGIATLPKDCRTGIFAARHIYAAIGAQIAGQDYDSVTQRAYTSTGQKLRLIGRAAAHNIASLTMPRPAYLHAKPLAEVAFLVDAAAKNTKQRPARSEALLSVLADLKRRDYTPAALEAAE